MSKRESSKYKVRHPQMWVVTNYGIVHGIGHRRRDAIHAAVLNCVGGRCSPTDSERLDKKWKEIEPYHDVRKVTLRDGW